MALGLGALVLALLQLLVGRRLVEQRQQELGADVATKVLLAEVAWSASPPPLSRRSAACGWRWEPIPSRWPPGGI